ncbi:ABC transporter substrate-binding protein [Streptomyces iconiensis]|uniref:ABC transporter substrate-binding protein n=1 Tax=Streptomyces iconiensis TaxID=1384038 RepID=A0ABT6ZWK2_9ACTN|nr:ABC transporter substrate-binding protein [Streptomyces iconiensis]MDJ1133456.1 ABC transporter substrate-binding protein [Streptomyces iconiensis]
MRIRLSTLQVRLAAAVTLSALLLTGCGSDSGSTSDAGDGPEKKTLTVAALPLADAAGLQIALDRKLFEKEGLSVRVQPVQQSVQALPALAKGQVDVIAGANYVSFLQAREKGTLKTLFLAEAARNAPHMMDVLVPPDSDIRSAKDLKGKRVAVNILNNIQSLTLNGILREKGAGRPEYRQVPFPQMGTVLKRGQVDAVHVAEPFRTALKRELKARTVVDGAARPADAIPLSGYATTEGFAEKNPRTAAAFARAINKAQAVAAKDRGAVEKALPSYTKIKPAEASAIGLPAFPDRPGAGQLDRLIALMKDQDLLKKDLAASDVLYEPGK